MLYRFWTSSYWHKGFSKSEKYWLWWSNNTLHLHQSSKTIVNTLTGNNFVFQLLIFYYTILLHQRLTLSHQHCSSCSTAPQYSFIFRVSQPHEKGRGREPGEFPVGLTGWVKAPLSKVFFFSTFEICNKTRHQHVFSLPTYSEAQSRRLFASLWVMMARCVHWFTMTGCRDY